MERGVRPLSSNLLCVRSLSRRFRRRTLLVSINTVRPQGVAWDGAYTYFYVASQGNWNSVNQYNNTGGFLKAYCSGAGLSAPTYFVWYTPPS